MKIYVKASADSEIKQLCKTAEKMIKENLVSAGLKKKYLPMLNISVIPAGSGFRATVVLPKKGFHGAKESVFFYKRDLDDSIHTLCTGLINRRQLIKYQMELDKPDRPQSSTAKFLSEARNTSDPDRLRELAKHNALSVRKAVAKNTNTPEDVLFDLILADDPEITENIYLSRFKSPEYFYKIFDLGSVRWNIQLSHLKNLPEDLYYKLFDFGLDKAKTNYRYMTGSDIIGNLASNPGTPEDIYYKIYELNDKNEDWHLSCGADSFHCPIPVDIIEGLLDRHPDWTDLRRFKLRLDNGEI